MAVKPLNKRGRCCGCWFFRRRSSRAGCVFRTEAARLDHQDEQEGASFGDGDRVAIGGLRHDCCATSPTRFAPGTNAFNKSLMAWGVGATEKAYVITKDANENVAKSARNIERVVQTDVTHLNVYDVLNADKVVVRRPAAHIQSFFGENGQAWE